MAAVFKIPRAWRPSLVARTALYPALYLRWAGHRATITADPGFGAWVAAQLRVLIADGPLQDDDRELILRSAERRLPILLAGHATLPAADRAFAAANGCAFVAWTDPGPLASPPRPITGSAWRFPPACR